MFQRYSVKRKKNKLSWFRISLFLFLFSLLIYGIVYFVALLEWKNLFSDFTRNDLFVLWEKRDYKNLFEQSQKILETNAYHKQALLFNSMSAYYLFIDNRNQTYYLELIQSHLNKVLVLFDEFYPFEYTDIYYILGLAYYYQGFYWIDLAQDNLEEVYDLDPTYPNLLLYLSLVYFSLENYSQSLSYLHQRDQNLLNYQESLLYLRILDKLNKEEEYKKYYRVLLDKWGDKEKLDLLIYLANNFMNKENYRLAEKFYLEALDIDPNHVLIYNRLIILYQKTKNKIKERAQMRKLAQIRTRR